MIKENVIHKILIVYVFKTISFTSYAQEFTFTTTSANIISAKALIDLPGLSGNTQAIIVATPLGNTKMLNPHPTGAWYYSGKWNLFNSDFAVMIPGLTYKVQYFLTPGPNQFLHLITQQNLGSEGSYIDHHALNNHPEVLFTIFQNHSPDVRPGSFLNPYEAKAGYSAAASKWYITNVAGQPLLKGSAYNIVIGADTTNGSPPGGGSCNCPAALPPNGLAGGDLAGTYPNPKVQKFSGNPLSNVAPTIGQILKWNGTEWIPGDETKGTTNSSPITNALEFFCSKETTINSQQGMDDLPGLDQTINLPVASKVVASISMFGENMGCFACGVNHVGVMLYVDDMSIFSFVVCKYLETNNGKLFYESSGPRVLTLPAGNHRFKMKFQKEAHSAIRIIPDVRGQSTKMTLLIMPQ